MKQIAHIYSFVLRLYAQCWKSGSISFAIRPSLSAKPVFDSVVDQDHYTYWEYV